MFLAEMGQDEPGLNRLIRAAFKLLGLQTYFTAGVKEVRAWTIHVGDTAPQAERLTTVALRDGGHRSLADALQWEALAQGVTLTTADLREGIAAASERRTPIFRGE